MSLQDLELSPFLISELYRDALVPVKTGEAIEETPAHARPKPQAAPPSYEGTDLASLGLPPVTAPPMEAAAESPLSQQSALQDSPGQEPLAENKQSAPVTPPQPVSVQNTVETKQANNQYTAQRAIKFLGGNKKRIAFIVNCKTDVYLPDNQLDWLGKMLDACKLNLGDVAIANIADNKFTIADIKNELQSTAVILLGTEPFAIQLPLNFPHFNLQSYDNMTFLYTPSPDQLNQPTNEAKLLKSKLWVCLQKLFKL
jgi:hypothetical protein